MIQSLMLASVAAADAFMLGGVDQNFLPECKVLFLSSFVFFLGCICVPEHLMVLFTNEPELIAIGADYLRIAGWSYLLTGISQCYLVILKVTDHTADAAKISSAAVVLNIILNLAGLWKAYPVLTGDFVRCLLPMIGAALLWGVGFTSYTAFMGHMGTDAAAANSIASVVRDLVCCMCNGLASGGGILVGNELGAGNLSTGREYGDRLMKLSFVCGLLSTAIMFAVTPLLIHVVKLTALGAFVFHWPVEVVYACTCLDEVGKIPWVIYHYKKYKWVKDLTREMI